MSLCGYPEERKRTISCVCCRGKISQRGTFEKQILLELLFVHYATVCDSRVRACAQATCPTEDARSVLSLASWNLAERVHSGILWGLHERTVEHHALGWVKG